MPIGKTLRIVAGCAVLLGSTGIARAQVLPGGPGTSLAIAGSGWVPAPVRQDLNRALRTWQKKLGLAGWTVAVEVVSDGVLGGSAMGDVVWNLKTKRASIRILREEDYDLPLRMARLDQQATILHELVHLQHAASGDVMGNVESAVVRETNSLLRANRQWQVLAVQEH